MVGESQLKKFWMRSFKKQIRQLFRQIQGGYFYLFTQLIQFSVHSSSPQPPQNLDGPGIYTTNHSLMDRVTQEPYLAEQLLKVSFINRLKTVISYRINR
jgi:hypothetical protein